VEPWHLLWSELRNYGIRHTPGGFEHVAQPLSLRESRLRLADGSIVPCLVVECVVPLAEPGPPITLDDVLDGAKAAQDETFVAAWLDELRRRVGL
jgi:hypothetical protein